MDEALNQNQNHYVTEVELPMNVLQKWPILQSNLESLQYTMSNSLLVAVYIDKNVLKEKNQLILMFLQQTFKDLNIFVLRIMQD